jgi:hypothetical protein
LHATSENAAGSLAACAVMGAQGFSNAAPPADFETFITSSCTAQTKLQPPPLSVWPATCNPTGMATALNLFTPNAHWIVATFADTQQAAALNETVRSLQTFGSPAVVPIYGQADHWVAVIQITATVLAPGSFAITQVKGFDGGRIGGFDSGGTNFYVGLQTWGGAPWRGTFFLVVTAINAACDFLPGGCGAAPNNDPFFNRYVLMYEPPLNSHNAEAPTTTFEKSPGILPSGTHGMNESVAQHRVWDSLIAAGINQDPQNWNALIGGVAGPAHHVSAVWPDGSPWDYYLVPILSAPDTAIAFVQLSGDDGAFEGVNVPTFPVPFTPASTTKANDHARGLLKNGERLTGGTLTWNPRASSAVSGSPNYPYYQYTVAGSKSSVVQVSLHNGKATRVD